MNISHERILYIYRKEYEFYSPDIFLFSENNKNNLIVDYVGGDWFFDNGRECKASKNYRFRHIGDGTGLIYWNG